MGRTGAAFLAAILALAGAAAAPGDACVGRTLYVGYFDAPDQVLVANLLAVFIDERTGTTVVLRKFGSREEAFEAVRRDKVSIYADYSRVILGKFPGERPEADEAKNVARLKDALNRDHNLVWLETFGYDRYFPDRGKTAEAPGQAGLMICKDALSKFPALPKLLAKLRGTLDNDTLSVLLREAGSSDAKAVARRFLKSRKLI